MISVRAREAHSGPHAQHFWDAETAGGGALLDMGCHTIEAARYFFGKDIPMTEAFAWGATLSHADKTTGEDNAVALIKFANGGISITESSWSMKGGMELRNEITGTGGRLVTDTTETPVYGFITNPAGYLMEKADAETGFVYPIPEEARVYGYTQELRHFVDCFRDGHRAARDVRRRLHRQLRARRVLPLDEERPLGADRGRPRARRRPGPGCGGGMTPATTVRYLDGARELLDRVAGQDPALEQAADLCADAIGGGGLVHLFGTGHSRIAVEEMFPRYGSYPGFHPIVELSMTFHTQVVGANGQRQAMFIERVEGLGEVILRNFDLRPPDAMMVFSASGLGAVPIEVARGARERGLAVIAVTSLAATEAGESTHSTGSRLRDHADVVLDLCTPPADALVDDRRAWTPPWVRARRSPRWRSPTR